MGFFYNKNGIIGVISTLLTFVAVIILCFALVTVLVNVIIFALPVILVLWLGYRGMKYINSYTVHRRSEKSPENFKVEIIDKDKHFEDAILNNRIIFAGLGNDSGIRGNNRKQ